MTKPLATRLRSRGHAMRAMTLARLGLIASAAFSSPAWGQVVR